MCLLLILEMVGRLARNEGICLGAPVDRQQDIRIEFNVTEYRRPGNEDGAPASGGRRVNGTLTRKFPRYPDHFPARFSDLHPYNEFAKETAVLGNREGKDCAFRKAASSKLSVSGKARSFQCYIKPWMRVKVE